MLFRQSYLFIDEKEYNNNLHKNYYELCNGNRTYETMETCYKNVLKIELLISIGAKLKTTNVNIYSY